MNEIETITKTVKEFKETRIKEEQRFKNRELNWDQFKEHMLAFESQLKRYGTCF